MQVNRASHFAPFVLALLSKIGMPDIARRLKKTREELSRFQQQFHAKQLEREKLVQEVEKAEQEIRRIRSLERELRMKRSLLGRLDIELKRIYSQKVRLAREIPSFEREFQKIDRERRIGKRTA